MYQLYSKGKKTVGIAQTGSGWNVATYSVSGNRVRTYKEGNTRTLAQAKKLFTKYKRSL